MPLARRLSSSSFGDAASVDGSKAAATAKSRQTRATKLVQEPITRQLLARRLSNRGISGRASLSSADPPHQNKDTTTKKGTPAKKKRTKDEKENDSKRTSTPRETRATKKLKTSEKKANKGTSSYGSVASSVAAQQHENVLFFSPPDQKANAKREKEEIERKLNARYVLK